MSDMTPELRLELNMQRVLDALHHGADHFLFSVNPRLSGAVDIQATVERSAFESWVTALGGSLDQVETTEREGGDEYPLMSVWDSGDGITVCRVHEAGEPDA